MKTKLVIGVLAASAAVLCAAPAMAQQSGGSQPPAAQQSSASQQSSAQQSDANQNLPGWFVDTFRGGA